MEEILLVVLGAGVVALVPAVPALRRLGKIGVKGGLMVAEAIREPVATVGHNWRDMVNEAKEETQAGDQAEQPMSSAAEPVAEAGATTKAARKQPRRLRT